MTASGVFSRSRDYLLNLRQHLAMKPFARELRRVRTNRGTVPRAAFRVVERRAERVYRRVLEKNPRDAVDDGVADTAGAEGDDGRTDGRRIERRDTEVFDPGKNQASCAAEVIDDHVPRYGSEELNVGSAAGAKG